MNLYEIIKNSGIVKDRCLGNGWKSSEVAGLTDDSRKVKPGFLFVAVKGLEHDGHDYIARAIENGAATVVYESKSKIKDQRSKIQVKDRDVTWIEVADTRRALGLLWAGWYGNPSEKLKVIGVTGTDGKTTTANLIYHLLKTAGRKAGLISTINARIGNREIDTGFHVTNPEPELLQKLLSEMVKEGLEYVVLEVTSHGIDQERIAGVKFLGGVITNVTHEHLDYHKTYHKYLETKGRLFKNVDFSVLNGDDGSFSYIKKVAGGQKITYSQRGAGDVSAKKINVRDTLSAFAIRVGSKLTKSLSLHSGILLADWGSVKINLPGVYNVSNALAAASAALFLGISPADIKKGLESFRGLPGRFEEIKMGQPFRVIVDFAHTPNALKQVLGQISKTIRQSADKKSKIICVFGCAGERDKGKREMMGEISGCIADLSVLTAEDPRREDVNSIIRQIAKGCEKAGAKEVKRIKSQELRIKDRGRLFVRIPDRREAIDYALSHAASGDLVIISGKGHEKSMCFGTTEYPWSDQEAVRQLLKGLRYGKKDTRSLIPDS
ncbi:MAG: UDP-N-acetylmuramoyl-L-alanyl-D-glutamate--2,6-diaminopimelate ligase [Patescibacteria group bacterium]|nr:UDP-N-acetylmuramoyl-L-alanyl-D-glutamate--2,6-diaminopimelate ligase [Patescibacteria group bacterium]